MKTAHDLLAAAKARIQEISVDQADAAILKADALIDVREADEYAAGHLPGALLIPRGLLEFKLSMMPQLNDRALPIVVYCQGGGRSALAASTLMDMGYLNVRSLAGGFEAWNKAGKPVIRPEPVKYD